MGKKGLSTCFVFLIILNLFLFVPVFGEGLIEKYEEFEDDVIFEKKYLDLPTYESSFEKDLGSVGTISGIAYISLGKAALRLPTRIKARYDTILEPFSTNIVEMGVDPYNGEGPEFKYIMGFNLSVTYDPPGPEWLTGELSVGDFDTGFNFEGDFAPPLDGDWEASSTESFSGSIGLRKLLSFDIGLDARYKIIGEKIQGHIYEEDPYAEVKDVGAHGIVLRGGSYTEQFGIKDWDQYTTLDGYVDFEAYDLRYMVGFKIEVVNFLIGFSFAGFSWTWKIPTFMALEVPAGEDEIYVAEKDSDETTYQMSRIPIPGGAPREQNYDTPLFNVETPSTAYAEPGATFQTEIELHHSVVNPPPGYEIPSTTLKVYNEEGELAATFPVSPSDFENKKILLTLTMPPSVDPGSQFYSYKVSLDPPVLDPWFRGLVPARPRSATLRVTQARPDLNIRQEDLGVSFRGYNLESLGVYESSIQRIGVTISNDGDSPSTPTSVRLWLYKGMPDIPAYGDINLILSQSTLISSQPLPPLLLGGSHATQFLYTVPPGMKEKTLTFLIQVDGEEAVPEIHEENNLAFTTSEITETSRGIQWTFEITHLSYEKLASEYDVPVAEIVSNVALENAQNEAAHTEAPVFVDAMDNLAEWELPVVDQLDGQVPDDLRDDYFAAVNALYTQIQSVQTQGGYGQLSVLQIMDQQLQVVEIVERIWSGTVQGHVIDGSTGEPVSGATVAAQDLTGMRAETVTDDDGMFVLGLLAPATYTISVNTSGYATATEQITLLPSTTVPRTISLSPTSGDLSLTVSEEETGDPIKGALVTLTIHDQRLTTMTPSNGNIILTDLPTGIHQAEVEKENFETSQTIVRIKSQEVKIEEVHLTPLDIHDTAIIGINVMQSVIHMGEAGNLVVTAGNEGMWPETVSLTVYANETAIITDSISLSRQTYQTFVYNWDTEGMPPGAYEITVTVTPVTGERETGDNTQTYGIIRVQDTEPPNASAGEDQTISVEEQVTFDATASTDNDEIEIYSWDYGDGATGTGPTTTHKYSRQGAYTVTLTTKDRSGNTDTDSVTITVEKKGGLPNNLVLLIGAAILLAFIIYVMRKR